MDLIRDILSWFFLGTGGALMLISALGVLRMPDFYTRLHPAGITDTLAAEFMLTGMAIQAGFTLLTVKLFIIGLFLFFTSPTSTHATANAAFVAGLRPVVADDGPEGDRA